jgi:hypothetical protein
MRLYEATYEYQDIGTGNNIKQELYLLAPDFQSAAKLAGNNEKICEWFRAGGNMADILSKIELIAFDVLQE